MSQLKLPLPGIKGWSGSTCGGSGSKPLEMREVSLSNVTEYSRIEGLCQVCDRWIVVAKKSDRLYRHMSKVKVKIDEPKDLDE